MLVIFKLVARDDTRTLQNKAYANAAIMGSRYRYTIDTSGELHSPIHSQASYTNSRHQKRAILPPASGRCIGTSFAWNLPQC